MIPYPFEKVEPRLSRSQVRDPATAGAGGLSILEERFPHVVDALQRMWGHPELEIYFQRLMMDERGSRQGFPEEVWSELYFLLQLHRGAFPCAVR